MRTTQRIETHILLFALVTLLIGLAPARAGTPDAVRTELGKQIRQRCVESEISGGILVYLGDPGRDLVRDLARISQESFLVRGLLPGSRDLGALRRRLLADGLYGNVSLVHWAGPDLPFIPNMVNVLMVDLSTTMPREELLRVLAPHGIALVRNGDSVEVIQKERPQEYDDWTHYLHDAGNNAVSTDTQIDSIACQQWVAGPPWSRHHDHVASLTALVSDGRRIFYVFDEGKTSSILLPSKHALIARDAFNGTVLWKKSLPSWFPHLWPFKSGPAQLPRRLVTEGGKVYLPLGMAEPLSVLDAATGEVVRTFPQTDAVEEVLVSDGKLFVLANPDPEMFESLTLGNGLNSEQKSWAGRNWPWDKKKRNLMVFDDATGKRLWQKSATVAPLTLAVGAKGLMFYDGTSVVALDKADGNELWRSEEISAKEQLPIYESPILVLYGDYVLFAGSDGKMNGLDARDGRTLWEAEHLKGGHFSPKDLLVVDNLVWSANIAGTRQPRSGIFVGRDLSTGEVVREIKPAEVTYHFPHHRCHRVKATSRYILASKTGIEFYDTKKCIESVHHWVRGGCLYGIMPANGLVYAPMHSCACFLDSKLTGFNALAPKWAAGHGPQVKDRLERGPAYGKASGFNIQVSREDWPAYRHDNQRSGSTACEVRATVGVSWKMKVGSRVSSPTIAGGKVFVADIDGHTVYALDAKKGENLWSYTAGGRVDSPPTIHKGFAYFGSADGYVYCVAAEDGQLAWRFLVAGRDMQLCAYGQIESVWPVSGSVLVKNGKLFCVGGRSSFLDGGLPFVRLDAATGALEAESWIDAVDPKSGQSIQMLPEQSQKPPANPDMQMPSALPDILSSDGKNIFMRVEKLSDDGKRIGTFTRRGIEDEYDERH
ncbi:MAG: outer membrane protein assembly factor BamB family protein, partial [Planctomycetota bacterium]